MTCRIIENRVVAPEVGQWWDRSGVTYDILAVKKEADGAFVPKTGQKRPTRRRRAKAQPSFGVIEREFDEIYHDMAKHELALALRAVHEDPARRSQERSQL